MSIIEIAKDCGAFEPIGENVGMIIFTNNQLQAFATTNAKQAVEEYKASLVPVAYVDKNSSGQISMKSYYSDYFDMSKFVGITLYALGETK